MYTRQARWLQHQYRVERLQVIDAGWEVGQAVGGGYLSRTGLQQDEQERTQASSPLESLQIS